MTEKGEGQPQVQKNILPPIKFFDRVVAWAPEFKWELDELYVWWRSVNNNFSYLKRFESAISSDALPVEEGKSGRPIFDKLKGFFDKANDSLTQVVARPFGKMQAFRQLIGMAHEETLLDDAREAIGEYNESVDSHIPDQTIALAEAIAETKDVNKDPQSMRKKVAQYVFTEIISKIPYQRALRQAGINQEETLEDDLETEKDQLLFALKNEPWDKARTEEMRQLYEKLRKEIENLDFNIFSIGEFAYIWDCATGRIGNKTSAFEILRRGREAWESIRLEPSLRSIWGFGTNEEGKPAE